MASSANVLQAAIFARLTGDSALTGMIGAGSVFDRRMTGRPMPYVVLGEILTVEFGPDTEEHRVTIEVWSEAPGLRQAQEITGRVKLLVDGAGLVLAGFALVNLAHLRTRTGRERKTRAVLAEMVFRAVTE